LTSFFSKWSRERKEYTCKGVTVCIDKNAGYGYVAEFEKMIPEKDAEEVAKNEIRELMNVLVCTELPQDRLERMFAFYNKNWPEYYGTDKTFVIQ
jgi:adenylate cyclase class IV